jgi:two-component system nitrate/nitrite response regulator NarP
MARIVLADDHPIVLKGVAAVLEGSTHQVVGMAQDGDEALALAQSSNADMLVVDYRMPRRSGVEVLRQLRDAGDLRQVVLMMASIDNPALNQALALGVNGVLLKASAPAQLLMCLDQVVRGQRWIDPSLFDQVMTASKAESGGALASLTQRERNIVRLVVSGRKNRDIGEQLGMTEGNVKVTLHRIYDKLNVTNRVELAMLAHDQFESETVPA